MEPVTLIGIITAVIPFATALFKKVFKTDQIPDGTRSGIHALIPLVIGILSAGLAAHATGSDWITSLVIGLGSGGVASSARDLDKNLIGIADFILSLFKKKDETKGS